ncbi:hypothetical protein [Comamonas antarctica]|uniref:hypothetical protein n=1 Tax=Comamonas antarctica TaxID=2743470 RepID=UPI0028E51B03|nr:hypothetical protein [Comamonas antarctica]
MQSLTTSPENAVGAAHVGAAHVEAVYTEEVFAEAAYAEAAFAGAAFAGAAFAGAACAEAAKPHPAPVPARSFTFDMPLFRPGVEVQEGGRTETVSHVILRRREMMVYLVGREEPVRPDRLRLPPTRFTTARRAEGLSWFL